MCISLKSRLEIASATIGFAAISVFNKLLSETISQTILIYSIILLYFFQYPDTNKIKEWVIANPCWAWIEV